MGAERIGNLRGFFGRRTSLTDEEAFAAGDAEIARRNTEGTLGSTALGGKALSDALDDLVNRHASDG